MSPFRTVKASAEWLGIGQKEVRRLIKAGFLDARNLGAKKKIMITVKSLEEFAESRRVLPVTPSLTRFQADRERFRSLTTQTQARPLTKGA